MAALARGDFSAGASKFESFVATYAHDARVEDALYLRAIALERAHRMADARIVARHYLAAYPNGDHRKQAQRIARD
jgi:TolA-binding protein